MNPLLLSRLLLTSLLSLALPEYSLGVQLPRDPFRRPAPATDPRRWDQQLSPRAAAQQLRQWRLQGVLGHPHRGLWGLVRAPSGEWRCLRVGDVIMGYRVTAIDDRRVVLHKCQSSSAPPSPPLILPWGDSEPADLPEALG